IPRNTILFPAKPENNPANSLSFCREYMAYPTSGCCCDPYVPSAILPKDSYLVLASESNAHFPAIPAHNHADAYSSPRQAPANDLFPALQADIAAGCRAVAVLQYHHHTQTGECLPTPNP